MLAARAVGNAEEVQFFANTYSWFLSQLGCDIWREICERRALISLLNATSSGSTEQLTSVFSSKDTHLMTLSLRVEGSVWSHRGAKPGPLR